MTIFDYLKTINKNNIPFKFITHYDSYHVDPIQRLGRIVEEGDGYIIVYWYRSRTPHILFEENIVIIEDKK